jgi:hypothetical protein
MKKLAMLLFVLALCVPALGDANSINIDLKTAGNFGALAGSAVTNTGNTVINGDVGSSPTSTITGFPPGVVNGTLYLAANSVVAQAKLDLGDAYLAARDALDGNTSEPNDLSGRTLDPNIYTFGTFGDSVKFTGTLTLDGGEDPNAKWLFQIPSTLTTGSDSNVVLINGASARNVFWQVGSSATIGGNNRFAGNILAMTSISLGGGTLNGRALARNGAVTISTAETINVPDYVPGEANVPSEANHVPSSAILVYKVNQSLLSRWQLDFEKTSRDVEIDDEDPCDPNQQPPLNAEWDTTTLTSARPSSSKITGYIVMDVNVTSLRVNDMDPNSDSNTITAHDANAISDGVGLIIIDKKAKTYQVIYKTWMANAAKTGWVTDANYGSIDHSGIFKAEVVKNKKGKEMPKKTLDVFGLEADVHSYKGTDVNGVSTWDQEEWEWNFDTMTGALNKVDIDGTGIKVLVPKSLKGTAWDVAGNTIVGMQTIKENSKTTVTTRSEVRTEEELSGKASMVLHVKLTKEANAGAVKWTTSSTIDKIIESLPSTYTEVPNVPNAVDVDYDD